MRVSTRLAGVLCVYVGGYQVTPQVSYSRAGLFSVNFGFQEKGVTVTSTPNSTQLRQVPPTRRGSPKNVRTPGVPQSSC